MKHPFVQRGLALLLVLLLVHWPATASACTACMGDPNNKTAGAINAAMFLMIGFIGAVLCSLGGFAFYLARRANAPLPPHFELGAAINDSDDLT